MVFSNVYFLIAPMVFSNVYFLIDGVSNVLIVPNGVL